MILIGIYLAHGSVIPRMEVRLVDTKECRTLADEYVKRAVKGQAWAICAKPKGLK